ncbi:mpv17-like protein 2 [Parasteatoda tepidariorum]|uniref:mpv17-like protein 2 n=1 Tax=Parasteatoda tepidariorum TaxID=114398 RepID=UPI00077FBD26|nr:mpv17-like protein 2 [Parasteatoda tepidariorum]
MSFVSRLKNLTNKLFTKHLFITNTTLGVFFFGVADVVQQNIEMKLYEGKPYEAKRTANLLLSGSIIGVAGHHWYSFLDRRFPGTAYKQVAKKLLSEMVIGPPVFLAFFLLVGFFDGKPVKTSMAEFKKNILLILAADWAVYAPLQAINFLYLHPKYRFLYVCGLSFMYDIFLSYILHKDENKKYKKVEG